MRIQFDFACPVGPVKAMHGVGQPPRLGTSDAHMHYLTEAHIPFSRLHDVGGRFAAFLFVDIPNIFRDFDADADDPAAYDFAFTDQLIDQLLAAKCQPIYRLGVTIENDSYLHAYRIYPPASFTKWAQICEHIIRHYNEGWANGFHHGITYWEIWNEADGVSAKTNTPEMWLGTPEEYYELYDVTAKHLKHCFGDTIKIGGPAQCGCDAFLRDPQKYIAEIRPADCPDDRLTRILDFSIGFLDYISKSKAPLDFYSWHCYNALKDLPLQMTYMNRLLEQYGFQDVEQQLNEWNPDPLPHLRGSSQAAATAAAFMTVGQYAKNMEILCYYDARIGQSVYGGMFNPISYEPFCLYYAFKAFGELYCLGTQVKMDHENGLDDVYAVAATNGQGKAVMIVNCGEKRTIETNLVGMRAKLIDAEHLFTDIEMDSSSITLDKHQIVYLYEGDVDQ